MFILEEAIIKDGVAEPVQQVHFEQLNDGLNAHQVYMKQSDDHWIVLFDSSNPFQAIAIK